MVPSTQGDGELIADLAAERPALREAQMVGIRRSATANQARLLGHISDVIAVANPARLRQSQHALIDHLRSRPVLRLLGWMRAVRSQRLLNFVRRLRLICGARRKARQSGLESFLDALRIGCRQLVLFGERPMRPKCGIIAGCKITEFAQKSIAQCCRRFGPQRRLRRDLIEACHRGEQPQR